MASVHQVCCCDAEERACCFYSGGVAVDCQTLTQEQCQNVGGVWQRFGQVGPCVPGDPAARCPPIGPCSRCAYDPAPPGGGVIQVTLPYSVVVGFPNLIYCPENFQPGSFNRTFTECLRDNVLVFINAPPEGLHILTQTPPGQTSCGWRKDIVIHEGNCNEPGGVPLTFTCAIEHALYQAPNTMRHRYTVERAGGLHSLRAFSWGSIEWPNGFSPPLPCSGPVTPWTVTTWGTHSTQNPPLILPTNCAEAAAIVPGGVFPGISDAACYMDNYTQFSVEF